MPPALPQIALRPLAVADIPLVDEFRQAAGWNQTRQDWERFIRQEPEGCFLATWNGIPAGTVTTITYGQKLAWIGMMLVDPDYRRRGISTVLMQRALTFLKGRGIHCIKLDATPAGEPVYQKLGFQPEWELQRWVRVASETCVKSTHKDGCSVLEENLLLDLEAFGADRSRWLTKLWNQSCVQATTAGYGLMRNGVVADYLGPVIARDEATAAEIVKQLLCRSECQVYWDIPCPNNAAARLATSLGFVPVRRLLRMWTGQELICGRPCLQYGICDPATG